MKDHCRSRRVAPVRSILIASTLLLSACAEPVVTRALKFPFSQNYANARHSAPVLLENNLWWHQLEDQTLNKLIGNALSDNLSLSITRTRVQAARLSVQTISSAASVTSSASLGVEGVGSDTPSIRSTGDLGLSWMLDPWGARRNQLRAAFAREKAAEAELDAAHLLLLFNITNSYAELRYRQELLHLAEHDLAGAVRTERLLRKLKDAKEATRLDVARAQARTASLRATLPELGSSITAKINELSVLTGHAPGRLEKGLRRDLKAVKPQLRATMTPDTGIPADLIRNRPDIIILEQSYEEAIAEINIAQAALYPSLSLSGLISINTLVNSTSRPEYFFGPTIQFPDLPLKSARARVKLRHARAEQAYKEWENTILTAILEVENALVDYAAVARAIGAAQRAVSLSEETVSLTRTVLGKGEATVLDLITAQQNLATANRTLADLRFRQVQGFTAINVGLGAGRDARSTDKTL